MKKLTFLLLSCIVLYPALNFGQGDSVEFADLEPATVIDVPAAPQFSDTDSADVKIDFGGGLKKVFNSTGLAKFFSRIEVATVEPHEVEQGEVVLKGLKTVRISMSGMKSLFMVIVGFILLYLGVAKRVEPLLMIPIGFGALLANSPGSGLIEANGFLSIIFENGIRNELFPILIFMGIGAMSDFTSLIANPRLALLGAAAQLGVFGTLIGVVAVSEWFGLGFDIRSACSVAIIGAADGPTSIYLSSKYAPELMGSIAIAAYSYMAMVPLIQPPVMRALTTDAERKIRMPISRRVSKKELVLFPLLVLVLCVLFLPPALPLLGSFCFGNFVKECGVAERLSNSLQNEVTNIATILLGLGVGMQLEASKFLTAVTLAILFLGLLAFILGTAGGVIFAKLMNKVWKNSPVNPLIGSAGVSAFPMSARVSHYMGLKYDSGNNLIFQAMGANLSGQIGSVVAAGVIMALLGT